MPPVAHTSPPDLYDHFLNFSTTYIHSSRRPHNVPDDVCAICAASRRDHGDKNHQFSRDGKLVPLSNGRSATQPRPQADDEETRRAWIEQHRPGLVPDLVLRTALLAKGILTTEDLDEAQRIIDSAHTRIEELAASLIRHPAAPPQFSEPQLDLQDRENA